MVTLVTNTTYHLGNEVELYCGGGEAEQQSSHRCQTIYYGCWVIFELNGNGVGVTSLQNFNYITEEEMECA